MLLLFVLLCNSESPNSIDVGPFSPDWCPSAAPGSPPDNRTDAAHRVPEMQEERRMLDISQVECGLFGGSSHLTGAHLLRLVALLIIGRMRHIGCLKCKKKEGC
jgi:hypothetical protein